MSYTQLIKQVFGVRFPARYRRSQCQILADILGKPKDQDQWDLFAPFLTDFIDRRHPLTLLAKRMDRTYLEK